jgi:hypothetical protein
VVAQDHEVEGLEGAKAEAEEEAEECPEKRAEDNCLPIFAPSQEPGSTGQPPLALE